MSASLEHVTSLLTAAFKLEVTSVVPLGGYLGQNFLVTTSSDRFVLKGFSNDAHTQAHVEAQIEAIKLARHLMPDTDLPSIIPSQNGQDICADDKTLWILQTYVGGDLIGEGPAAQSELLQSVGQVVGMLDRTLQNFNHSGAVRRDMEWDLADALMYRDYTDLIEDPESRRLADYFFLQFEAEGFSRLSKLRRQFVHNDCHRFALKTDNLRQHVTGVIDFGDLTFSYRICHLAVTISDFLTGQDDIVSSAALITGSYHQAFPLSEDEITLLYDLVGLRYGLYLAHAARMRREHPNNVHAQSKVTDVEHNLRRLIATNPIAFGDALRASCGFETLNRQAKAEQLVAQRRQYFSSSLYTHYDDPLVLSRGSLQYLHASDGKSYLDCVNNVSQSGHCNPHIARAARRQTSILNTNSRYVYAQMNELAERLLSYFPDNLDTVFFVNSGSEANDLAMRLASTYTKGSQFIVLDEAYHGNSTASTDISPNRIGRPGGLGMPNYVHRLMLPDAYRNVPPGFSGSVTDAFLAELPDLIEKTKGELAAFVAESLVGTGGQFPFPKNYLNTIYAAVRDAGGITIADEVQVGFGRTGDMWCFEEQGVIPDIVTMGKPIANGHPMGAVVTNRAIAEAFDQKVVYFNTFGGNPVSCATALGVLDVLEKDQLLKNVNARAHQLLEGLDALQRKHSLIGDIRGRGLYIGVELVVDRATKEPAREEAKRCVEAMKSRGFLLNTNGYFNNVIKIKPPLIINEADIQSLIHNLDLVLSEIVV